MDYYNEHDKFAAAWLRELIADGQLPPGDVDERDIQDVRPNDLAGYTQCHFFAGIGGWKLALMRAGWPDDRPVWTGSCPCQPFSAAGKRTGSADERHLWPSWFWLIQQCSPATVFGEQVASPDALVWLDIVQPDLEGAGYAVGVADMCAAGVGAPHIRQRLWFVADSARQRWDWSKATAEPDGRRLTETDRAIGRMADMHGARPFPGAHGGIHRGKKSDGAWHGESQRFGDAGGVANTERERVWAFRPGGAGSATGAVQGDGAQRERFWFDAGAGHNDVGAGTGPTNGLWRDADWLACRDGKWRPVEPGTFPLAHGVPNRVGALRGYGNAINPENGATFIRAVM